MIPPFFENEKKMLKKTAYFYSNGIDESVFM